MNQENRHYKKNQFDYVIVGSGLAGLLMARALTKEGAKVALLEAADHDANSFHEVATEFGSKENILTLVPDTEVAHRSLEFVSKLLSNESTESLAEQNIDLPTQDLDLLTYESGSLREFIGFGDQSPEFYDELAYYLRKSEIIPNPVVASWSKKLLELMPTLEYSPHQYATKFVMQEDRIIGVMVNGQKQIETNNVIYAGPTRRLPVLLPEGVLSSKAIQKLSKTKFWTAIGLDLVHDHVVTESKAIHILNGTTQDDLGPCVGRFYSANQNDEKTWQCSQWLSFVDDLDAEDIEKIGLALKKIKRQIKRAYPEAFEKLLSEKILAIPGFGGHAELKLTGHQTLPQLNNFWIASPEVHSQRNLLGVIGQVQLVCSAMGVNPMGEEIISDNTTTEVEADI